jgi:DNA polymerase-4
VDPRFILHLDLDEFIAAVEVLRRPELRGKPVVVGGAGDPTLRGVVATASYAAREFGVRSGMPLRTAARRCPDATFLPSDPTAYEDASAQVMDVLRGFDAVVEVAGWDEAFLDVATADPEAFARAIQDAVHARTALRSSVGIGDNKLRAKLASGFAKPAGVYRLTRDNWREVMDSRQTDELWGIGAKTARKLAARLDIRTVYDLAVADPEQLAGVFGPTIGPWLRRVARGVDPSPVLAEPYLARSRGKEVTYQTDLADPARIRAEIARLAADVVKEVAGEGRPAVRVGVKVRFVPFDTHTHSVPLAAPTAEEAPIAAAALAALEKFDLTRPVRLLGVRAELTRPM